MARIMLLIWAFRQSRRPATDWHDGQFAHNVHAQFSLGLSGKSVIWPPELSSSIFKIPDLDLRVVE